MRRNSPLALAALLLPAVLLAPGPSARTLGAASQDAGGSAAAGAPRAPVDLEVEALLARAHALEAEGSFALAHEVWRELDALELDAALARRVDLHLADALWRAAAATSDPDATRLDAGRRGVQAVIDAYADPRDRDETWALAQESLGDFHWDRRGAASWHAAWPFYEAALAFWGASTDLERARERWLAIVRRAATPSWVEAWHGYASYGNRLPRATLRDALSLARSDDERALAHWLLATSLVAESGGPREVARAPEHLEAVLAIGRATEWYDDALYQLGLWHEQRGELVRAKGGGWSFEPRYPRAVEVYRRLLREFAPGETQYRDDAERRLDELLRPSLTLGVDGTFLPGSKVPLSLAWRNVERIELSLHPFDPLRDLGRVPSVEEWLEGIDLRALEPAQRWTHETRDAGDHAPGSAELLVPEDPPLGAYVLVARADGVERRELVLVTDALLVVKTSGERVLAWATDARTGEPLAGAGALVIERRSDRTRTHRGATGEDGVVVFELAEPDRYLDALVAVARGERAAFARVSRWHGRPDDEAWRVLAFTDRPAYRPGDVVGWKVLVRTRAGAGAYATPAGATLAYELRDPRGEVVREGALELSDFGSAWAELETDETLALGEYHVTFRVAGAHVGSARLFRLEEYELPEFEVEVAVARDEDGTPRAVRPGERVEAEIRATTYYGAPIGAAEVEVLVHQRPFRRRPTPLFEPDLPWLGSERRVQRPWYGPGVLVHRELVRTGADGVARVSFETPDAAQDFEYTLEARVTDASRREVTGTGLVRVTRQAFFVDVEPAHRIHRPGDDVEVGVATRDPNGAPVSARGVIEAVRERMVEAWRDARGHTVTGDELARARREHASFPPDGWTPLAPLVEREVVATTVLGTDGEGRASWTFRAARDGRYVVTWRAEDAFGSAVEGSCQLFVADETTRELGWHHGGVRIVLDEDALRAGETAPVLLSIPASGGWVLFTVEGVDLVRWQVLRVDGTAELVRLAVDETMVPNVVLGAVTVRDAEVHVDQAAVRVPPLEHFLDVEVAFAEGEHLPGAAGELVVTARGRDGEPVRAELALTVYDAAVEAIDAGAAGDPRERFFGELRPHLVALAVSPGMGRYRRVALDEEGRPVDERELAGRRRAEGSYGTYRGSGDAVAKDLGGEGDGYYLDDSLAPEREQSEVRLGAAHDFAGAPAPGRQQAVEVVVRSDFRDTALWEPAVVTGADGTVRVKVRFPEQTTRWSVVARAATAADRFGYAVAETRTRKPLVVRLQAPRFFVVGDEVVLSALVDNRTAEEQPVRAELEAAGLELVGRVVDGVVGDDFGTLAIAAGASARFDWLVRVRAPGEARLRATAVSPAHGDGMERVVPVVAHGVETFLGVSGRLDGERVAVPLDLPAARAAGTTSLVVQVAPSLAVTMLDALPYLVEYPYGCTEQTLSRFVPAVIALGTLERVGLSRAEAARRVFGGIERAHAAATHPDERVGLEALDDVVAKGLARLHDSQHADGGWGWWPEGESDPWMTAYVVWGLELARTAGVDVRADVLERGAEWLEIRLVEAEDEPELAAWMLHALVQRLAATGEAPSELVTKAYARLVDRKRHLNAYGTALLALTAHGLGRAEDARALARNLANGALRDVQGASSVPGGAGEPGGLETVHWGEDGVTWRWSEGGVEATAFALRALLRIDPGSELALPALQWLVANRRGAQWKSTRDTAIVVLALSEWLERSGELAAPAAFAVRVGGELVAERALAPDDLLGAPSRFAVPAELLRSGANEVVIERLAGEGPLWWSLEASFTSEEEPVPPRWNLLFVRREYWKLVPVPTLLDGVRYRREPLADGDAVRSGERVEVVLTIEAENHLEYLAFEDLKPAGLEAVQVRSGEPLFARELRADEVERRFGRGLRDQVREDAGHPGGRAALHSDPLDGGTGRTRWVHQELRDRKVALFVDRLPQGVWEIRYDLRAETPGTFHALPVLGHAMYVPEIRANGSESRLEVLDRAADRG